MATDSKIKKLPLEAQKKLLLTPCKTKKELANFIKFFFELDIPDCKVSRYSDCAPLDAVWEPYKICVLRQNDENLKDLLYVASRGSGKTLGMAIAELMILLHDGRDVVHIGAIMAQAKRCYAYQQKFLFNAKIKDIVMPAKVRDDDRILVNPTMEKSTFNINSNTVTLEVIPLTLKSCNDPESIVIRNNEYIKIKEVKKGDRLLTQDLHNFTDEEVEVLDSRIVKRHCIKLVDESGRSINCAHDHMLLTSNGWMKAIDIQIGHKLLFRDMPFEYSKGWDDFKDEIDTEEKAESAIVGMLLGDANINCNFKNGKRIGNPRIYYGHSKPQWEYLYYTSSVFSKYLNVKRIRDKKSGYGSEMKEISTENTPKLNKMWNLFIENRKKVIKDELYEFLNPISLACWFMDDGTIDRRNKMISFATCGFSDEEINKLIGIFSKKFGLNSAHILGADNKRILSFSTEDSAKLIDMMHPYIHKSMQYKIKHRRSNKAYDVLTGIEADFSKNGLPKTNPKEYNKQCNRKWRNNFKSKHFVVIKDKQFLGERETILIETNSKSFDKQSFWVNGFLNHNCNGPHSSVVVCDEIDVVDGEGLKAYDEVNGILDSRGDQDPLRIGISTRKSRYGLMNKLMENADKEGRTVRKWTVLEFTKRCEDNRSGINPTQAYVNLEKMETLTEEQYNNKEPNKQKDYEPITLPGEKCLKCVISSVCRGDLKNQKSSSPLLKKVDDVIQKVKASGVDWSLAQLFNLKPSMEGIVYHEFEEETHVKNWNQMWRILTGVEYPGECSHDIFVKKCHELKLPCYGMTDWGWSSPSTIVYFFVDKKENIYVVKCDGMSHVSQPQWIHYIKTRYHNKYRCQLYFPDVADQGAVMEMRRVLPVSNTNFKPEINFGINIIKKMLRVPGQVDPKLFVARETCAPLIHEFMTYHFKTMSDGSISEIPSDENNHYLDALRYAMSELFGKNNILLPSDYDSSLLDEVRDESGLFYRAPTAEEFAKSQGINFTNNLDEIDKSQIGQIGTRKELENLEDSEDGIQGGDGFFWSF